MQSIRQIERLNQTELDKCIPPNASWHTDYRDTAYLYIGGLPFELSEGDILIIFSQYGNPVHINLVRDKDTGKSRGFCFLRYEDQRSCDLAVDNLSGAGIMGRVISVDHTRYKKKEGEVEGIGDEDLEDPDETDREGDKRRKRRKTDESEGEEERPMIKEEIELQKLLRKHDDDDPMKEYLVEAKREEVAEALKAVARQRPSSGRANTVFGVTIIVIKTDPEESHRTELSPAPILGRSIARVTIDPVITQLETLLPLIRNRRVCEADATNRGIEDAKIVPRDRLHRQGLDVKG
ncbi:hypothetical protein BST61_g5305 [Cercospora zeina]